MVITTVLLQRSSAGGRGAFPIDIGIEGSPESCCASRMREDLKVWETFPLDSEVDQLILKIVQLEFAKTLSPLDIVDRCLYWRKLERRKTVRYWEDILRVSCERLRVSLPKDLSRPYIPSSRLPDESGLAKMQTNVEKKAKKVLFSIVGGVRKAVQQFVDEHPLTPEQQRLLYKEMKRIAEGTGSHGIDVDFQDNILGGIF